ncbi:SdrD B-like domain-containing protein [Trichormus sp. NMC-1]|uniref:SdrD B-like domain-containing protein n=1 Tax=Trichormus sp. NMC-1 TaxID=1853259 RepID=UPI0009F610AF|nr:SdrD B-like domain-containing protein [Trichormus sp. NMC-1]
MADNFSIFNSTLQDTVGERIVDYDISNTTRFGLPSYVNVTISNGGLLNGSYDAWCANSIVQMSTGTTIYTAATYSTYEIIPTGVLQNDSQTLIRSSTDTDQFLNKLQQINWLFNNVTEKANLSTTNANAYVYNNVTYFRGDIQLALWKILGDQIPTDLTTLGTTYDKTFAKANALVQAAVTNGSTFVPVAGQDIAVIVAGKDANGNSVQPLFLEVKTAGIGDFVWEDLNANGIQDANESGIDGATVTLLNASGDVLGTTTTGDNPNTAAIEKGWYQFGPLLPNITVNYNSSGGSTVTNSPNGSYQVRFTLPTDFNTVSPYLQGSNTSFDSNANPSNNFTSTPIILRGGEINNTIDAGFYKKASLGDFVFNDGNNNGIQDAGEAGVGGVTVELINPANGSVIATTTTDGTGAYTFTGLTPGNYQVKFTSPTGYVFSTANQGGDDTVDSDANTSTGLTQTVTLTSGEFNGTLDAGLVQLASLGDKVFHDLDADGIQDAGEQGIANASVNLLDTAGNVIATTTTDGDGLYSFNDLQPGDYKVQFVQPNDFTNVSTANVGVDDSVDSDAAGNLTTGVINLSPGENDTTVDAGFYNTASLGDFVFNDGNNNGIQDAGEAGVSGVTVELINPADGSVIATTTTDETGAYTFTGLTPGDYQVKFTSPTGYVFSTANQGGDDTVDSDANTSTGLTQTVTLTSGEFNGTLDAGLVQLASLGDKVFHDLDADGIQDAGEQGIANASVNLLDTAGNVIATTTTDGDGLYSFTNLQPGDYKVQFVQPNDFTNVSTANVGVDDSVDSDAAGNLTTGVINLSPGENDTTVDAGFYNTASLGDFVFNDANNNGIQDAGEAGIGEVTVELINPTDGSVIATTTTDGTGAYTFTGLTPGDYQVKFTSPTGYVFSTANQGGDDTVDSDANTSTGLTQTVTLTSGEFNGTLDAGLVQLASLGDKVFHDLDADGIQDAGEQGIANASVNLLDTAGNVIATTTTDGDGLYSFTNLQPGDYKVQFVQPNDFTNVSTANVGVDDSVDSDAAGNLTTGVINLSPGENDTTVDAGFYNTASLGDFVFNDGNNNGIQDAGEAGIGEVTVELINPTDGSVIATTTTDGTGAYTFTGLTPGDYQVKFTSPTGYVFSTANQGGDDTVDSDANTSTGLTQTVTLTSGEFNGTLDAGLVQLASLGDKVFHDLDADGIQDAGEQGIANASVNLLDTAGNVIATTTTDGDGLYSFNDLQPGDYKVQFVQPNDFTNVSTANVGVDDSVDSDAAGNLTTGVINLSPGENDTTVDAGFYNTASLGDFVFNDGNNNGIQDAGEAGVSGVTVELINPADGSVIATTTTNTNGGYQFSGLTPGDYQVQFTAPTGYSFSTSDQGGNDAVDSDANTSTGLTQTVTLTSGDFNGTLDAGLVPLASLGNFVFEDKNANGIQDAGEAGINNATVNLLDANGNFIATTSTNGSGLYSFTNLQPGDYKVQFVQPNDFTNVSTANVGVDDSVDSDAAGNLTTGVINLSPGENDTTVDAGFYNTASLGDFVFNDGNNNGIQDAGETGLEDVIVDLINPADGSVITSTTTDANGNYQFSGLTPGDYQVQFTAPEGYSFTRDNEGNNDAKDSDANPSTGLTQTVTLTSGQFNDTLDAGLVRRASLGDFVFEDSNANGIQDDGETGIGGATVKLLNATGTTVISSTTTDSDGLYSFTNLLPGDYKIQFVQPTGFNGVSPTNVGGDDSVDSDGLISDVVNLSPGENDTTVDAGFYKTASLGDFVFNDSSKNGIQDAGEDGVAGVTVTLIGGGADGLISTTADNTTETKTTDTSGNYNFTGLTPGQQYQVQFSNLPTGYQFTQANVGIDDAVDSDANTTTGKTQIVTLASGENNTTVDAGISQIAPPTVRIGDRVWYDTNGNGIQETGESGVAGVSVKLFSQAGTQIGTATTDADGLYEFTVNTNNTYSVQFVQPTGFDGFTTANVGNSAVDSNVVNANGSTTQFFVGTADNFTIDAGLIKNISDLSITKTDGLTTVAPGQQITYTIVVANNGLMTATDALVSDIIPSLLTNVTWTSVATGGARNNQLSGTGNINDYVTLTGGSSITYTVNATVGASPSSSSSSVSSTTTFDFTGNSFTTGANGNSRTFTKDGISVNARAFSRVDGTNGAWSTAYLGSYSGGLGVTDSSETGTFHRVDNGGGRDNYVLFRFSESVIIDRAYLEYVVNDSDISVWIGNFNSPVTNLSDSILSSFGFTEVNLGGSSSRWANINAANNVGNTLVIAAKTDDTNDQFKIEYLDVQKYVAPTTTSLINTATVTPPTGFTDTNPNNNSATDTDTLINAPGVRTPGFWQNTEWQKFWDGIQGNEPSQKTQPNFPGSDLLFAPYTNSEQPGKVLDPVRGQYDIGLLIGDYNRNGKTDTGENTIFYTLNQARQIVDSSQHPNTDKRYDLGRSLVAGWLNYLAGNPIDTANATDKDERYYINEGINWLQGFTPDENGDKKGDGAIFRMTGSTVSSPQLANSFWNLGISSASSLPSAYRSNTNVLYPLDSGSVINTNLDNYNNGLGLADGVVSG